MSTNAPRKVKEMTPKEKEAYREWLSKQTFPAPPPKAPIRVVITRDWGRR
jgi:hypothetical protein